MRILIALVPLALLGGCLSSVPAPPVDCWMLEYRGPQARARTEPSFGIVRLSQTAVRMPYASDKMVVLRRDGTVAFDSRNVFAAPPSALAKSAAAEALKSSGLFADVIGAGSGVSAAASAEVEISRLALDCRREGERRAVVGMALRLLKGKTQIFAAVGEGGADAANGDYGAAFSQAFTEAFGAVIEQLRQCR